MDNITEEPTYAYTEKTVQKLETEVLDLKIARIDIEMRMKIAEETIEKIVVINRELIKRLLKTEMLLEKHIKTKIGVIKGNKATNKGSYGKEY